MIETNETPRSTGGDDTRLIVVSDADGSLDTERATSVVYDEITFVVDWAMPEERLDCTWLG